MELGNPM